MTDQVKLVRAKTKLKRESRIVTIVKRDERSEQPESVGDGPMHFDEDMISAYDQASCAAHAIVYGIEFEHIHLGKRDWPGTDHLDTFPFALFLAAGIAGRHIGVFAEPDMDEEGVAVSILECHNDVQIPDLLLVEKLLRSDGRLPWRKKDREAPMLEFLIEAVRASRERWCMIEPIAIALLKHRKLSRRECLDVAFSEEAHVVKWKSVASEFPTVIRAAFSSRGGIRAAFGLSYAEVVQTVRSFELAKGLNPRNWKVIGEFERGEAVEAGNA